ncbi:MAG: PAS domain S-box protein [Thermoplasmatota archaeon]
MAKKTQGSKNKKKKDTETALETLVNYHPNPMVLAQIDGTIIYANQQFADIFGKKKEDIIETSGFDLLTIDTGKRRTVFINELINNKQTVVFEDHDVNRHWKTVMNPVINKTGTVEKIAIYIQEITEQKKDEEKKLELKEKFYHRLIKNSSDIFSITEKDGTIRFISESTKSITGYNARFLERKNFFEFVHKNDRKKVREFYDHLLNSTKQLKPIEYQLKKKDGTFVYVESVGVNLLQDSQISGIILTTRDITERKKTTQLLDQSERYFKSIVSSMSEIILLLDAQDIFIDAYAPKGFPLYKTKEEFLGKNIAMVMPKAVTTAYTKAAKKVRKTTKPQTIEYPLRIKGTTHWFLSTLDLYVDKESIIISVLDITERRRIEENLRKSDQLLRSIFNDPETFIGILDLDGYLLQANKSSLDFIDASPADVQGMKFWKTPWWHHSKGLQHKLKTAIRRARAGKVQRFEALHIGKNQQKINVLFCLRPVINDEQKIVSLIAEGYDITKLKQAERKTNIMKNYLQDAINSALEIIIIIDTNQVITFWNNRAAEITHLEIMDVMGKEITSISAFSHTSEFERALKQCYKEGSTTFDLIVQPRNKPKKLIRVLSSVITNEKNSILGQILVGRDITHQSNIHGRLVPGKSYLIPGRTNERALLVFSDLIQSGFKGLMFARDAHHFPHNFDCLDDCALVVFDEIASHSHHAQSPGDVMKKVELFLNKHTKSVILLDRIDYLLALYSFEQVMKLIYQINNLVSQHHALFFLRVNPTLLEHYQYKLLEEELSMLPDQMNIDITLDQKLYDLLLFIYQQNQHNMLVSFKTIGDYFSITKVTTAKRVKELEERGFIVVTKRGRMKTSHITDLGKKLLQKRSAI